VYRADSKQAAFTRQVGFSALQHEQLVLNYAHQHGRIRRAGVMGLCRLSEGKTKEVLRRMKDAGQLELEGNGRGASYRPRPAA
jgi:ATP-dependent DNA helicase RecG